MKHSTIETPLTRHNNHRRVSFHRMRDWQRWPLVAIIACVLGAPLSGLSQTHIPSTYVVPVAAADTSQPGFIWRVHQLDAWQPNDNTRTEKQLAGLLGDNLADPAAVGAALAAASPPSPATAPIRFDLAGVVNLNVPGFGSQGSFVPDEMMPGIPGTTGGFENAAGEISTWLSLPAGTTTLGVNSDDGFLMTIGGSRPVDKFARTVGEFNGGRPAGDTLFQIIVAEPGLYAVLVTWEQGCCEASLELFSEQPDGTRVLLNDVANGGIPAYRSANIPDRAYARSINPAPNSTGVPASSPIVVELVDGAFPIDVASTTLKLDGAVVPAIISKSGSVTTVSYTPTPPLAEGTIHEATLSYTENGSLVQALWTFTMAHRIGPNGHAFEVVLVEDGITWPDAKAAAESKGGPGVVSHLATITSYAEDLFLELLRQASRPGRPDGQLWVGGYQAMDSPDYWEPGGGWTWVNGEGPINSYNWGWPYANWQWWWQPDNAYTDLGGSEDYLAIGLNGVFGWNDDGFDGGGRRDGTLAGYIVEYEPVLLLVDIKPDDAKNSINLVSNGKLPVAVLATPAFDPARLDIASIRFGRTGREAAPVGWSRADVNGDNLKDLLLQFEVQDTELIGDDVEAVLTAQTLTGLPAQGRDGIHVVQSPHYTLSASAMMDVNRVAEMELVVQALTATAVTPSVAKQVQLKSYDGVGHLRWSQSLKNVPLQQWWAQYSVGTLQFGDAVARQPVNVKALVPDSTGKNTEVLHTKTVVKLRPDLAVENLLVPPSSDACSIVNIVATVRELNGDLGASAVAYLYDGDQIVDAASIWLEPNRSADVVFSRIFGQGGSHTLKVVVGDVSPGDFDLSNNATDTRVIEIGQRTFSPPVFSANYDRTHYEYRWEEQNPYYSSVWLENGNTETLRAWFSFSPFLEFPFQDVVVELAGDGVPREVIQLGLIEADYSYSSGSYYDGYAYRQIGDSSYLYLRSYSSGDCQDAITVEYYRSSAQYVYHSEYHDLYWGTSEVADWVYHYGTPFEASSSYEVRLIIEHETGVIGGTTGSIPVYSYPFETIWDYEWPDYGFSRGYYRGEQFYGYGYGVLAP